VIAATVGLLAALAAPSSDVPRADALARQAAAIVQSDPGGAWRVAQEALRASELFDPTSFITAGRRGEIADDEYRAARAQYRRHRAGLFLVAGRAQLGRGQALAASRYLRRALDLDPGLDPVPLARSQLALGRRWEALGTLADGLTAGTAGPDAGVVAAQAADALGLPSVQTELDRRRVLAAGQAGMAWIGGPLKIPAGTRLSTGGRFSFGDDDHLRVLYVADEGCATCSADLEALGRLVPPATQVLLAAQGNDDVLRQVMALYHITWPVLMGSGVGRALPVKAPAVLVVARSGWSVARAGDPLDRSMPELMAILQRHDITESVPRPTWNGSLPHRPAAGGGSGAQPLPGGLVPGEDEPWPAEFVQAVESFGAGRYAQALGLVDQLAERDDGWLLAPEARLDRALCLAGQGHRSEARHLLLSIGDSRYEDHVDQLIETLGAVGPGARKTQ
jgi:tetratricopeptide (TPR) repeat protein